MNSTAFSENELEIAKRWLERKSNTEIAKELNKSEPYISQTLKKIKEKIQTLENSIGLLQGLKIIEPVPPIKLAGQAKEPHYCSKTQLDDKSKLAFPYLQFALGGGSSTELLKLSSTGEKAKSLLTQNQRPDVVLQSGSSVGFSSIKISSSDIGSGPYR